MSFRALRGTPRLALFALTLASVSLGAPRARAEEMDLALSRLRVDLGGGIFGPDDAAFQSLVSQLGAAVAPPVLGAPRTLGYTGFQVAVEGWATGIDGSADYWERGTEGDALSGVEGRNRFVPGALYAGRLAVRKGLPFGLEIGGSVGHFASTSMFTLGGEVQWAPFEGFRTGIGAIPDIAFRVMVQTVVAHPQLTLTVPSVDVVVGKRLTVGRSGTLSPFLSYQLYWIVADSELVDFTPGADAFDACSPEPGPPVAGGAAATVRCTGSALDYENQGAFAGARFARQRITFGVDGRYGFLSARASFALDVVSPSEADSEAPAALARQWTTALSLGLVF